MKNRELRALLAKFSPEAEVLQLAEVQGEVVLDPVMTVSAERANSRERGGIRVYEQGDDAQVGDVPVIVLYRAASHEKAANFEREERREQRLTDARANQLDVDAMLDEHAQD